MPTNKSLAKAYFTALLEGELSDSLLTDDMTAWTTMSGDTDKQGYQFMVKMLRVMCPDHLQFNIKSLTAEDDRVLAEAESEATLLNGDSYCNTYIFVFRIRDGRIAHIAEHFNSRTVQQKLVPLMKQVSAQIAQTNKK